MKKHILFLIAFLPIFVFAQTPPDTTYSDQVISQASVVGFNLEGAEVSYTLNDTVNNVFELIAFGATDVNGEYIVDSLPVLKYSTGTDNPIIKQVANESIIITNNGNGPNHKITISGLKEVNKDAYILDMTGQQVAVLLLHQDFANKSFETIWNGEKTKNGLYLFYVKTNNGIFGKKILHIENGPAGIGYGAKPFPGAVKKSSNVITDDEAISKYIRHITSQFTENYVDTVYVHEDLEHYFEAELEHLPIDPTSVSGEILVNGEFPAYNANIQIINLTDGSIIFNLEANGEGIYTQDGMPVPIDAVFTAPETTEYEITTSASNPNNFEEKVDIVNMVSGENLQHNISVEANPIAPGSITGTILVNGEFPAYNANIEIKNLSDGSIIFNLEADANGNYTQDNMPVPIDAVFTAPETTEYEITTSADNPSNFEEVIDVVNMVSGENLLHNIAVVANPIADGTLSGTILVNGEFPAYNANIHLENTDDPSINFDFQTNEDGEYSLNNIPVPLDAAFTAPEIATYQMTVQAQNPNNWEEEINNINITSGENIDIDLDVAANPIDPAQVSGEVLINGETPAANANLHWINLNNPSITYDLATNAQGEYFDDNIDVPLDEIFTAPEDTEYEVTTTGDNLETRIDTFLITSGEENIHTIVANPFQYGDANIDGYVFFDNLTDVPDANIEFMRLANQSQIFSTITIMPSYYTLDVPVVYEVDHPGQTEYIITITPISVPFYTKVDTLLLSPGYNYVETLVEAIPPPIPTQDIEGIVREAYTKNPASGITVRVIDRSDGSLIEEVITSANGVYSFLDILAETEVEFELGSVDHFWSYNNEYNVPEEFEDTLIIFNRLVYPKSVEVPMVGDNYLIDGDGEEISEMVGEDVINFEEVLRHEDCMFPNNPFNPGYLDALEYIQNNFYEGNSPIVTVTTPRDITTTIQAGYEPYTNFYEGLLGWNIDFGGGNVTESIIVPTNYGVAATLGGEIEATSGGSEPLAPVIKEMQGRRLDFGDVTSPANGGRWSMLNGDPAMPTEKDRAYVYLILLNQKARFDSSEETYSLEFMTNEDPSDNKSNSSNEYTKYEDIPGTKPHCKKYFNHIK